VSLGEGRTPLTYETVMHCESYFKHDYLMPTGSFKDRGASVLISLANHLGLEPVVEDSSGNAGAAIAAYCARAGIPCRIFVPHATSVAKTRQIEMYGAELVKIRGSRENTARAAVDAAEYAFYASHYRHPLFFHGVKTMAYEIWEQMGGSVPGTVVVPVGNGSLLLGLSLGFTELLDMGLIRNLPMLVGVQASQCAPLVTRMNGGEPGVCPVFTIAEGIAIADPIQGDRVIDAVRTTGGAMITVPEEDIAKSHLWAWRRGLCIEKTAAVGIAGVVRACSTLNPPPPILTVLTGHGLKTIH
nr:pyridoxal-phosphate dependent enzyme [bacterium]